MPPILEVIRSKEVSQADRSLLPACPNEYSTCEPPYTGERSFRRPHRNVNVRFSVYIVPPIPDNEHRNEYLLSAVFTAKSADPVGISGQKQAGPLSEPVGRLRFFHVVGHCYLPFR